MSYPTYALTLCKLIEQNIERAKRWHGGGLDQWTPLEWAGAMCGEAGEAANAAKKLKRLEDNIQTINEEARHFSTLAQARLAVSRECTDTILYALLLMAVVNVNPEVSIEDIIRDVFNRKSNEYGFPERI